MAKLTHDIGPVCRFGTALIKRACSPMALKPMVRQALLVLPFLLCFPAQAQIYLGSVSVIDGDTLVMGEERIRLHGIDAPEANQTCQRDSETWACGQAAADLLRELVHGQRIECQQRDRDVYGRIVATCRMGRIDLAEMMTSAGLAVALPQFSQDYVLSAERAQASRVGMWAGEFMMPADFRESDPESLQRAAEWNRQMTEEQASGSAADWPPMIASNQSNNQGIYFANCREARAAGAAPLYRGEPGYRPEMDGDGDGIACEPPRRR
ncbi:thermonuclease family protein [Aurantiacibacter gilvus]|uniref:Thermonuclease family protein n=1 Tax=Aurantiacibacter gilvus TaxID=3139141 RepID=A0ABU9IHI6_9SPHN